MSELTEFLRCDADGCGHVELIEKIEQSLVGKACPKCGESLLTQPDFDEWTASVAPMLALAKQMAGEAEDDMTDEEKLNAYEHHISVNLVDGKLKVNVGDDVAKRVDDS